MRKIETEKLLKGSGNFIGGDRHKYEIIEVESGYIYHSHAFNTSTFVPFKSGNTLESLKSLVNEWNKTPATTQEILSALNELISNQN